MYFYIDIKDPMTQETKRFLMTDVHGNSYTSFPMEDGNPNMDAYLAWVAQGNEPEIWNYNGLQNRRQKWQLKDITVLAGK